MARAERDRAAERGGATRKDLFAIEPEKIYVEKKDGPLFDVRANEKAKEELVDSIIEHGLIEPVVCRKVVTKGAVVFELEDGRLRHAAFTEAMKRMKKSGIPMKPCHEGGKITFVLKNGDDAYAEDIMVVANEHRYERTPTEKAELAVRMLSNGKSEEHVMRCFRCGEDTLANWKKTMAAVPSLRQEMQRGRVKPTVGYKIAALPIEEQKDAVKAAVEKYEGADPKKKGRGIGAAQIRDLNEHREKSGKKKPSKAKAEPTKAEKAPQRKIHENFAITEAPVASETRSKALAGKPQMRTIEEVDALVAKYESQLGSMGLAMCEWFKGDDRALDDYIQTEESPEKRTA